MEHNDRIRKVSQLLDEYIVLHDAVFAKKWWQIFKPIDFGWLQMRADEIRSEFSAVLTELQNETVGSENAEFNETLKKYVSALVSTLNAFSRVLLGLNQKSKGRDYPASTHKEELGIYEEMMDEYLKLGKRLNDLQK